MKNSQDYRNLISKVTMYLDNELNQEEERLLLREIQQNPSYRELLHQEQSFREFVKSRIQRRTVSPALVQSIKDHIKIHASG